MLRVIFYICFHLAVGLIELHAERKDLAHRALRREGMHPDRLNERDREVPVLLRREPMQPARNLFGLNLIRDVIHKKVHIKLPVLICAFLIPRLLAGLYFLESLKRDMIEIVRIAHKRDLAEHDAERMFFSPGQMLHKLRDRALPVLNGFCKKFSELHLFGDRLLKI